MVFLAAGEPDLCQWTEWTSCDFFCGTPRVHERTREKSSDGHCRTDLDTDVHIATEQCDAGQQCTSEYKSHIAKNMKPFSQLRSSLAPGRTQRTATNHAGKKGSSSRSEPALWSAQTSQPTFPAKVRRLSEQAEDARQAKSTAQVTLNLEEN